MAILGNHKRESKEISERAIKAVYCSSLRRSQHGTKKYHCIEKQILILVGLNMNVNPDWEEIECIQPSGGDEEFLNQTLIFFCLHY